jgi:hypothetical protein
MGCAGTSDLTRKLTPEEYRQALDPAVEKDLWAKQIAIDRLNTKKVMALVQGTGGLTRRVWGKIFRTPFPC